jgi:tetratricopeptide (TPR) repeat protein
VWRNEEGLYRHAIDVNPNAAKALTNLGWVLEQEGREAEALEVYARLAEVVPTNFRYHYLLGVKAYREGRLEEAEKWLNSAVERRGESRFAADIALAEVLADRGKRADAIDRLENAKRLADRSHFAASHRIHIARRLRELRGIAGAR